MFLGLLLLNSSCSSLGGFGKKNNGAVSSSISSSKLKTYDRIITKDAFSQKGLFDVHRVGNKYYFEIPDNLFNHEILVVTRFIKTPSGGGNYGGRSQI